MRTQRFPWCRRGLAAVVLILSGATLTEAQSECPAGFCEDPITSRCDAGGFEIGLIGYTPAPASDGGFASYTYQVCSPPTGTCVSTVRPGQACLDHSFCRTQGQDTDPSAYCTRTCAVDVFRALSHFDVGLPLLGAGSCLADGTQITGSCTGGAFVVGPDGACGGVFVAKCDSTDLAPGSCLEMTIQIAGELNAPGLGAAFVLSKESTDCNESCLAGPSCEPCDGGEEGEECLTRTRGFWGTHPHLIQSDDPRSLHLLPITVCGDPLTTVAHGHCSTSEALCTSAQDRKGNPVFLTLAAQLAAAKLNLAATAALSAGSCSSWVSDGMSIQNWIAYCEGSFCGASKQAISNSGCIEALDAFNNSQDVGFDQTPPPFDAPGPALVDECQLARGNGIWVGGGCSQPGP